MLYQIIFVCNLKVMLSDITRINMLESLLCQKGVVEWCVNT